MEIIDPMPAQRSHVCLVLMPYASLARPSLALGLLKSCLEGTEISCSTTYANLLFANTIGYDPYRLVECCSWPRIGDWTFAGAAFPDFSPDDREYLENAAGFALRIFPGFPHAPETLSSIMGVFQSIRDKASAFIDSLARTIIAREPRIVGCSSSFQQHVASLALLKRIKELDPHVITLIGGANCEDRMGVATVSSFSWVDISFSGEADEVFCDLCRTLVRSGCDVPSAMLPSGAINREIASKCNMECDNPIPRATVTNLDKLPIPDYSDYFHFLRTSGFSKRLRPGLIMETSRGCTWGGRKGCTFCGQNRKGMAFRSKKAARVLDEIECLSRQYGIRGVRMTDNVINPHYFHDLIPQLGKLPQKYSLHCTLRTTHSRDEVRALKEAGVIWVFFGVESLHDGWLKLMNKGTTAVVNLQTLKYATEFGMRVTWHLLHDFPGEQENWYYEMASLLPFLHHLPPPSHILHVAFDRFSSFHQGPGKYSVSLKPSPGYRYSYPLSAESLEKLAYSFEPTKARPNDTPGMMALRRAVGDWKMASMRFIPPVLCMTEQEDQIQIFDTRPCAPSSRVTLNGIESRIYKACEPAVRKDDLIKQLNTNSSIDHSIEEIFKAARLLIERKLLLEISGHLISLAIPGNIPSPVPYLPGGHDPLPSLQNLISSSSPL